MSWIFPRNIPIKPISCSTVSRWGTTTVITKSVITIAKMPSTSTGATGGTFLFNNTASGATFKVVCDLDRNGAIDDKEWQMARSAAEREIAHRHQEIRNQPTSHRLQKPGSNRPYLIANHPPEKLGRRYVWLSGVHLLLMLSSLVGIGWAMRLSG